MAAATVGLRVGRAALFVSARRQSRVMYYAAAPYYFLGFQTSLGYNGHFGYPAALQYADPPVPHRYYSRPAHRIEAYD